MASIDPTTVTCRDSTITGDVQIGACCAIHPKAVIIAYKGPIIIGTHNIIEELVHIVNDTDKPMRIGSYNYFSVGCKITASKIGSYNMFEVKSKVTTDVVIGDDCNIGSAVAIDESVIPPVFVVSYFSQDTHKALVPQYAQAIKAKETPPRLSKIAAFRLSDSVVIRPHTKWRPEHEKLIQVYLTALVCFDR